MFAAFEKQLRAEIPDAEVRGRVAGELLFYVEQDARRDPGFPAELETKIGKTRADQIFSLAHKVHRLNRLVLHTLRILWFILFVLGVWSMGRVFLNWGWNPLGSLLAAAFVTGAVLELGKRAVLLFLASRMS